MDEAYETKRNVNMKRNKYKERKETKMPQGTKGKERFGPENEKKKQRKLKGRLIIIRK